MKKFVVADVGGYGNKDLYQVSLKLILEDGVFVLIAFNSSTKFIEMARTVIWLRVSKFTNAGWALLGSPGAKGQQSSAGDSEKNNEEMAPLYRSVK